MRKSRARLPALWTICATACALAGAGVAAAAGPGAASEPLVATPATHDPALRDCARRALPERSMRQRQDVRVVSESGWERASSRMVYWRRDDDGGMEVLFEVERPKSDAGLKLLVIQRPERDPVLYVHTPDIERARRVVGSGASNSVLGTDFTFEDAMHLQGFLRAEGVRRVADAELEGFPVFVAETRPDADSSAYSLIRTYIDQSWCLPLRTEFFGPNGALDKTLVLAREAIVEMNGHHLPLRMIMYNHAQRTRTELTISEVAIDLPLPDSLFSFAHIRKSH